MIKKMKMAVVIFTVKQLRKLLTILYEDEKQKDEETKEIIKHLQNTLYDHTGSWWVS
jgi:hypothetical protein